MLSRQCFTLCSIQHNNYYLGGSLFRCSFAAPPLFLEFAKALCRGPRRQPPLPLRPQLSVRGPVCTYVSVSLRVRVWVLHEIACSNEPALSLRIISRSFSVDIINKNDTVCSLIARTKSKIQPPRYGFLRVKRIAATSLAQHRSNPSIRTCRPTLCWHNKSCTVNVSWPFFNVFSFRPSLRTRRRLVSPHSPRCSLLAPQERVYLWLWCWPSMTGNSCVIL